MAGYDVGDLVTLTATIKVRNVLTDPSTITFDILRPDAVVETFEYGTDVEVIRDSLGVYHMDYTPSQYGRHIWKVSGTGNAQAVEEKYFDVRKPSIV